MFVKYCVSTVVLFLLATPPAGAQAPAPATAHTAGDESAGADLIPFGPSLVGTWRGRTERLPLTGDFNEQVWGKNAVSIREVSLAVKSSGDATLTIARKVLDARGRVVPGSSSIEEANVTIGAAKPGFSSRLDHEVKVVKAERRYPDTPSDRWELDGLRVGVVSFTDSMDSLEVRFDPKDGQGAFADVLTKPRTGTRARR